MHIGGLECDAIARGLDACTVVEDDLIAGACCCTCWVEDKFEDIARRWVFDDGCVRIERVEARGRIGAGEGEVESVCGPCGLDGCGVRQGVGGFIVPGDEGAGRGGFPDLFVEVAIDARQILFVCVSKIEGRRFDA